MVRVLREYFSLSPFFCSQYRVCFVANGVGTARYTCVVLAGYLAGESGS